MQTINSAAAPLYRQIARRLKAAIESGELAPGKRLPASRVYAREIGVSRATVEAAYGELVAQGWLERRGQAGTFISDRLTAGAPRADTVRTAVDKSAPLPFQLGLPGLDLFPRALWARMMGRRLRVQTRADLAPGDPAGDPELRRAIVDYLLFSRGIECRPEQVYITSGYAAGMTLILDTLARPGDAIWMEDPGYRLIRPQIAGRGLALCPVPVDDNGIDVDAGMRTAPDARFVLVTPAHQSPTGVPLSLPRRRQLLAWAARRQAWIIEDDYDSEFHYRGRPLPPMKSLDAPQRIIYAGTFSKSLFPALRAGWLVVPEPLLECFEQQARLASCTVPTLVQQTLADFIDQGHFWRHLKKMRQHYARRREWLAQALAGLGYPTAPGAGGLHLMMPVRGSDRALAARGRAAGLAVQALSDWRLVSDGPGALLMGFTNMTDAQMAQGLAKKLIAAISGE
ncbi:PLP-dependent aminotransferase family protein [Pluralibacter gergoviae]